jgi:carboxyl-terminal processing protease
MKRILIISLVLFIVFSSCKKNDNTVPTGETPEMARDTLYDIMNQWYYWYNYMPAVNKNNYSDPYTLLEAMKYKAQDKWSFVADYDAFVAEMEGTFVGHGFRLAYNDQDATARIAMIYSGSPLYAIGVRRGWIVKSINGIDIAPILKSGDAIAYSNAIGPSTAGVTNSFVFIKPDGNETTVSSTKATFTVNSVLLYDTLHLSSGITGHLVFDSFIQPSQQELATAFAYFKANNATDLILDLRYNTGGYLYIAQALASYIGGNSLAGNQSVFVRLTYNALNQSQNESYQFQSTASPLSLPRLVVITSRLTASASEAVMNGLKPFIDVVGIGDTTYGKPVGMNGWETGKKYFFWPVTFKMVNADNQGDYYAGLPPAKIVTDDITHDFNDRRELCLNESIHYLETGSFSAKRASTFYRLKGFSEKPEWMNNGFTIIKPNK